jgi:hypothetical protein
MTKFSGWMMFALVGFALALPAGVSAQVPPKNKGAAAPRAAPHVAAPRAAAPHFAPRVAAPHFTPHVSAPRAVVHAAPRFTPHVAPHITTRRAAVPHINAHRAERRIATPRTGAPNNVQRAATPNLSPAQRAATPNLSPAQRRAQRREERRHAREQGQQTGPNAVTTSRTRANAVQPNAQSGVQSNTRAARRLRRGGNAQVTAQVSRRGRFASTFAGRAHASRAGADPASARRAWHHHRRAAFVAWYGPVFWPYAYSDIFDYAFWPDGYDDGYWAYAYDDFFDGLFWGEAGPPDQYVDAEPTVGAAPRPSYAGVQELCTEPGSGVTAWPFAQIERTVGLNAEQKSLLNDVRGAATKAAAVFKTSCPAQNAFPLTPPGRLQAMVGRLQATVEAVTTVRPALEAFYNSLSDEQKERFNELGPNTRVAKAGGETTGATPQEANSCKQPKEGLANLPIDKIEDVVKPTDAQEADLDALQDATGKAVSIMQGACPDETPLTPPGRLAAMQARLQAMIDAANTVKPSLDSFYSSLSNEQKARFNRIGEELAQSGG